MKRSGFLTVAIVVLVTGCAWREDPQYATVRYSVTGNATNVTITAVVDEWGTAATSTVAGLPWSLDYDNDEYTTEPPVYLRVEVTPGTAPLASGSADSYSLDQLADSTAAFVTAGVQVGDVALNTASGAVSIVTAVTATALTLTAGDDPFPAGNETYQVYRMVNMTASAYGDGQLLAQTTLGGWGSSPLTATVICENYTAP